MSNKKEMVAREVALAVSSGKAVALESVNYNDPHRHKTCLEVDFPILNVNQVAVIEGNAGKPIYQMSKWWARRRSSVFRSMLIAAATRAPEDQNYAAKLVWENYYANHQKKGAFSHLKVADIFMGGGTTLVEGSRLGMNMIGNDLNPVAWFVTKQEIANVDLEKVKQLVSDVEAEVKPAIMPYYYCDGPNGEKGTWTHLPTRQVMSANFDPLSIPHENRRDYNYDGPELIYTFWAKHGPCQVTGCGHRTPIMTNQIVAVKTLTVKHWEHSCSECGLNFHVEKDHTRIAPDVPQFLSPTEYPFSVLHKKNGVVCPRCGHSAMVKLEKGKNKKVELSLLVHPKWLEGIPKHDENGEPLGGSAQDNADSSALWNMRRASDIRLLEVRGELPNEVTCPETEVTFRPHSGTVPKKSSFTCGGCGTVQDVLSTVKASGKTGPMAAYAIQGYAPKRNSTGVPYSGRFFAPFDVQMANQYDTAAKEWEKRKDGDLADYWPRSELPFGFMTHMNNGGIPNHGYTHWWTMFNPRQLLVHAQLLRAIVTAGNYDLTVREFVLGAFLQYLRYQNMFVFWQIHRDCLAPHFSNNNFHPKANVVENSVFSDLGSGNWSSCVKNIFEGHEWITNPWESVSVEGLKRIDPSLADEISGKSEKVYPNDPVLGANIFCCSSTDLPQISDASVDFAITDPPFGGLLHYSELADFFYVWLRLVLKDNYQDYFAAEHTPKSLEAVSNRAREPEDPDGFYRRLLTQCWREAHRILKPGGILAFTFHHSEDEPWIAVLESLFEAGYYLEATYPIRSDETKGEGSKPGTFGSQTIEYDIIHVCRKRMEEPRPVSWGRLRREIMADVQQLKEMLENHAKQGLPAADLQVIRRGKALEHFSHHFGKVYVDEGRTISVKDALVGINQLIDEGTSKGKEIPPINAEPITRQFLRTFGTDSEMKRDQLQKFLRGTITTPDDFVQRGWCSERNKVFIRTNSLDFAREWVGKHRNRLTSDLDQALVIIGACFDGSGINATDTLKNVNFKPHVALKPLLEWLHRNGPDQATRNAALRAMSIYNAWVNSQAVKPIQGSIFEEYDL